MKDTLKYKGFLGSVEISFDDECLHGKILFIDDLVTYEANTPTELREAFTNSVDDYLDTCRELGREPNKPFRGTFNVRVGPELHQKLARYATQNKSSINDVIKKAVEEYIEKPKENESVHQHFHTHVAFEYQDTFTQEMSWLINDVQQSKIANC